MMVAQIGSVTSNSYLVKLMGDRSCFFHDIIRLYLRHATVSV